MLTYPKSRVLPQDGFLVLPGALDEGACAEMRDRMWAEISAAVPRLDRNDPKSWGPFTADESPSQRRPGPEFNDSHEGGDVRFECGPGHRYYLRNGADDFHLDFFPRALWDVAEQLLGRDELTYPNGEVDGKITGPCFMDAATESGLATHTAREPRWPPPLVTEELEITKTGPGAMNGQGTRGLYCTLPNSIDPREKKHSDGRPYAGMHSDGGIEGRIRLRATAFIDECPPGSGGFTMWRGSHGAMWQQQWQDLQKANSHVAQKSEAELEEEWEEGVRSGLTYRQRIEQRKGYDGYVSATASFLVVDASQCLNVKLLAPERPDHGRAARAGACGGVRPGRHRGAMGGRHSPRGRAEPAQRRHPPGVDLSAPQCPLLCLPLPRPG